MIGSGIDIVEISRFRTMKNFERFLKYTFTERERECLNGKKDIYESAAAGFAAKEAFSKYMGSGFRGFAPRDVEILYDEQGKPYIVFMDKPSAADVSLSHCGEYSVAVVCGEKSPMEGEYAELIKSYGHMLPKRRKDMHKGDSGRLLIAAGSLKMVGAACLCARAAMRTGSGLVTLATADCVQQTAAAKLNEIMTLPLPSDGGIISGDGAAEIADALRICDAAAIGPGLGRGGGIPVILSEFIKSGIPIVIDADGLNALSENIDMLNEKHGEIIITPHPVEMARLCGEKVPSNDKGRERIAVEFAKKYGVTVLLKGHRTVIASPKGEVHINESGNSGMASGGMGDVLTGIIASLCGQGVEVYNAAVLGAFIHGLAGDIAAGDKGKFGMIASDVIDKLPYAISAIDAYSAEK